MADLHEIQLPDGSKFRTALPPERLAELGLPPIERPAGTSLFDPAAAATAGLGIKMTQEEANRLSGAGPVLGGARYVPGGGSLADLPVPKVSAAPSTSIKIQEPPPDGALDLRFNPGLARFAESDADVRASKREADKAIAEQKKPATGRFGEERKDIDTGGGEGAPGYAPPAPRYVTIRAKDQKGADIRTGYSVQKSGASDLLPDYEDQAADARINAKLAGQELADNRADALERERGDAAREEIIRQQQAEALAARNAEIQRRKEEAAANLLALDAEHDQIQKLKVNPNQYWDNLGTGGKILAAIGMIAGGINAGMRGGPNQAAEFIYRSIRDDIQGQREKIEARRQGFNIKQTALEKRAAQLGGDLELATKELEANQLALVSAVGRKHAAETGLANVNPELMMMFAKMDEEAAASRIDNAAKYSAKVAESFQFIPDKTIQVGGGRPIKDLSRVVEMPDGSKRWARTDAQAKEAQAEVASNSEVASIAARIRAIREAPEDRMPLTAKKEQIRTEAGRLFLAIKRGEALGTLDKGALDFREEFIGKPEALISIGSDAKLGVIEQGARERVNNVDRFYLNTDPEGVGRGTGAVTPGRRYEP